MLRCSDDAVATMGEDAGRTRERLLVQAERNVDVQAYLHAWLDRVKLTAGVRMAVDVDPMSFF